VATGLSALGIKSLIYFSINPNLAAAVLPVCAVYQ